MAWTTSAYSRARPMLSELAALTKTVKFLLSSLRRSAMRLHPCFAFALPLAALGLSTPLLPPGLTATILTAAAAALALLAIVPVPFLPAGSLRPIAHTRGPQSQLLGRSRPRGATSFAEPDIDLERQAQRFTGQGLSVGQGLSARRPRAMFEQKDRLEQRDRIWTELMARVSHDLRTPLNAVMGFSELMALELFGPLGDERYQNYVHHIRDSAADLLKSAEDTLALTALMASPGRRDAACACNLEVLAADAWAFVARSAAGRAIDLAAAIPSELEVLGEPRALRQILVNVMSEAIGRAAYGERIILAAVTDGELIELAFSVSRERARAPRKGSTLAICLARTLLEMHGTSLLEVDSPSHGWRAVTVLDRAAQPDFFIERFGARARRDVPALVS